MPTQAHGISQDVSVFLEQRLLQEGHEHMQWSATLALGIVSTCLHDTDWNRKHKIVQLLLKVRMFCYYVYLHSMANRSRYYLACRRRQ
jgi:hypothetical protein